jgi:hypothetical protein
VRLLPTVSQYSPYTYTYLHRQLSILPFVPLPYSHSMVWVMGYGLWLNFSETLRRIEFLSSFCETIGFRLARWSNVADVNAFTFLVTGRTEQRLSYGILHVKAADPPVITCLTLSLSGYSHHRHTCLPSSHCRRHGAPYCISHHLLSPYQHIPDQTVGPQSYPFPTTVPPLFTL